MVKRLSRLNSRELKIIKEFLLARDGCKCKICDKYFPADELIVDHIDNDYTNWDPDNLQLANQSCNIKKNPPYRSKKDVDKRGGAEKDEGRGRLRLYTEIKAYLNFGDLAMFKNVYGELKFNDWLRKEMTKRMRIPVEEIIYDGANITGLQPKTTREYLKKLCYKTGPYERITEESEGIEYLQWKEKDFPFKEEIIKWAK